jgi:hypothetical protein
MTMLPEEDLGVRPLQADLFRLAPVQGATVVRRFDRGIVTLIVLNPLAARVYLRFTNRLPAAGDYDALVLPGSVGVFAVERYKWVAAFVDYAGQPSAQDNNLQASALESIVAYPPTMPGAAFGLAPSGILVPINVDAGGRLLPSPAGAGTDAGQGATTAAAGALAPAIAAVAGVTGYCTGFEVTGGGATGASVIDVTITGLLEGTLHYAMAIPAGATLGVLPLVVEFTRPRQASAVNTAITLNVPSFGAGNTLADAAIHGFRV